MTPPRLILVVDPEPDQLQTLCRGLFLIGIDFVTAGSAMEARSRLEAPGGDGIDLLLADLTTPGRSGAELIAQTRAARPELPVPVIARLALTPEVVAMRARGIPILRKPFSLDQLGLAIDVLLGARQPVNKGDSNEDPSRQ